MRRSVIAVTLVGAWLACLGWLAAREVRPAPEGSAPRGSARLAPGAAFYGVMLGGRQIGTAGVTLDTTPVGYRITEVTALDFPAGDGFRRDVARGEAVLSRSLRLQSAQLTVSEGGAPATFDAELRPDTSVVVRLRQGRAEADRAVLAAMDAAPTMPAAIPFRLVAGRLLRPRGAQVTADVDLMGRTFHVDRAVVDRDSVFIVSDSATRGPGGSGWVAVPGDSVRAWRVERLRGGALPIVDWVDARGRLVRREHAFGVTLERSPFEVNYTDYQAALRLRPAGDAAQPISGLGRLVDEAGAPPMGGGNRRVVVSRWDGPAWPRAAGALAGGRQAVTGDTIEILVAATGGTDSTPPPRRRNTAAWSSADSSVLQAALSSALAGSPGRDTIAVLAGWVARAVQYVDSTSAPTGSVTVARNRAGGLEGKVQLFVALAELAGYPSRAVYGVDVTRGHLPAHQWAEVWREGWEAVDPVFGQAPASTALLRIGVGATVRPLAMVTQAGGLRVSVLR